MPKYAQGSRFPALTGTPANMNQIFQATITAGLFSNETKRALDGLFNVNFKANYISFPVNQSSGLVGQPDGASRRAGRRPTTSATW
jgi:hypothetical protein